MSEQKAPESQVARTPQGEVADARTALEAPVGAEEATPPLVVADAEKDQQGEVSLSGLDIRGVLKGVKAPKTKPLLPLFEVISNAIDSLDDSGSDTPNIEVHLIRDESFVKVQEEGPGRPALAGVVGFRVEDNGVGFTTENCRSFSRYATTWKEKRGGLGVGRFLLLKAYYEVKITSVFSVEGQTFRREFVFSEASKVIPAATPVEQGPPLTTVELPLFRKDVVDPPPVTPSAIAVRIVEHFLNYFVNGKMPPISLVDDAQEKPDNKDIDLHRVFTERFSKSSEQLPLKVKNYDFDLTVYKLTETIDLRNHRLHLCADGREVTDERLADMFPDLPKPVGDEEPFFLSVYVAGDYLNERKNWERMAFDFDKAQESQTDAFDENAVTEKMFRDALKGKLEGHLREYLEPLEEEKVSAYKQYVHEEAPRYLALLKDPEKLRSLPRHAEKAKMEAELSKVWFKHTQKLREDSRSFLSQDVGALGADTYKQRLSDLSARVDDVGRSQLADYVCHRRVVLDLFDKALRRQEDGKFVKEDYLHALVCPRRVSSEDALPLESLNLWLIDERFSFYNYLASEKQHREVVPLDSEAGSEKKRTDILLVNTPHAFTDTGPPFSSVVVVEFKRPERDDFTDADNPVDQVLGYVQDFTDGKLKDWRGKSIPPGDQRQFFAYVLCDHTPSLSKLMKKRGMKRTHDGLAFYDYNSELRTYVQLITFDKLVEDARRRNQVLFERLCVE